jgi:hypothetical protein
VPEATTATNAARGRSEVTFTLEMREKTLGVWRRHPGTWVSVTTWTIDLTQAQYATCLAVLPRQRVRKAVSHA